MTLNEIKKSLYKQKPIAHKLHTGPFNYEYYCILDNKERVYFSVPMTEMGQYVFQEQEPAQHLIRWIKHKENDN